MKDKEPIQNNKDQNKLPPGQPELTQKPVNSTLGVEGNIFMSDGQPNGGPENSPPPIDPSETEKRADEAPHDTSPVSDRPQEFTQQEIQSAREELSRMAALPEDADVEVRRAYEEYKRDLLEIAGIRLGPANWANKDNDQPITVTGYFGKGPDGREYVRTEEFSGGTPLDEVQFPQPDSQETDRRTERQKDIDRIWDAARDYYSAIEEIIETAPIEQVSKAIEETGEGYIEFSTVGLPKNVAEKYQDSLKELKNQKDLRPEEVKKRFQEILKGIKNERKAAGLEDPLEASAPKVNLTDEQIKYLEKLQAEALEKTDSDTNISVDSVRRRLEQAAGITPRSSRGPVSERVDQEGESEVVKNQALINIVGSIANTIDTLGDNPQSAGILLNNQNIASIFGMAYGQGQEGMLVRQEWNSILSNLSAGKIDAEAAKEQLKGMIFRAYKNASSNMTTEEEAPASYRLNSIQALSQWIAAKQDRELWGRNGIYQLQDAEGNFNQANFLIWLRQQSNLLHSKSPNSEMVPLQSVGITTDYGNAVSIFGMSLQPEAYMRDRNRGRVLHELAGQLIDEAFMFGEIRNTDLYWRQNMGDDKKISDVIGAVHAKNTFTRPGNLQTLMRMSARFVENEAERDTIVGDAWRMGTEIYYNISDSEELLDIFKEHPLTQEDFKNAIRIRNKKLDWDEGRKIGDYQGIYDKEQGFIVPHLFKENGEVDMEVFVTFLNIYRTPSETVEKVELLRELVRIKTAQKYGSEVDPTTGKRSLGAGIALTTGELVIRRKHFNDLVEEYGKEEGKRRYMHERAAERVNVEFAENLSYGIQRVYGAASKHDLGRAGYDAFTKTNVQEYLAKQGDIGRGGSVGIPEQLGLFRDLAPDMISGLRTESGRTPYEILKDLRRIDNGEIVDIKDRDGDVIGQRTKKGLIEELTFKENAEFYQARNQQVRAIQAFHMVSDAQALDIDRIVTWNPLEGERMDVGEFQKQINEGVIKPFRYADINSGINFAEGQRIYDPHATKRLQDPIDKENMRIAKENRKIERENKIRKKNGQEPLPVAPLLQDAAPQYRDGTLLEKTKGKVIVDKVISDYETEKDPDGIRLNEKYETFEEFLESRDANIRAAKDSSLAVFAAQLRSHARFNTLGKKWGYTRTETFIKALETIQDYDYDEKTGKYKPNGKKYFSKKDIAWLRKNSGTEVWRMLRDDTVTQVGPAFGGGILEGFGIFVKALINSELKGSA
jgi:polyhydroxyalkanoate synthesis regulator phasin